MFLPINDIFFQLRTDLLANTNTAAAARMEGAAGWRIYRTRYITLQHNPAFFRIEIYYRNSRKQRLGIGVLSMSIQLISISQFNNPPQIHNRDTVSDIFNNTQIMGNKNIGNTALFFQIHQQIQYLCLDRNIQCRNCLIRNNQLRIKTERPCNTDALPLPA